MPISKRPSQDSIQLHAQSKNVRAHRSSLRSIRVTFPGSVTTKSTTRGLEVKRSGTIHFALATIVVLVFSFSSTARAQTIAQVKLAPSDLTGSAIFGTAVAANPNYLAVTAPSEGTGSVYVYSHTSSGWIQQAELQGADFSSRLAGGVSIYGDTIVTGGSGHAYIFGRSNDTWTIKATLTPNDLSSSFGGAVSISEDTIAVAGSNSVYVFEQDDVTGQWVQQAKFTGGFGFGTNLALDANTGTLVVGSPFSGNGSAVIFSHQHDTWTQQAVVGPGTGSTATMFGLGVAVSGNTVVVGAPGPGIDDDQPGTAFVFVNNNGTWTLQAQFTGPAGISQPGDEFGTSVALIGDTLLVGAYENPFNTEVGTASVFVRNNGVWSPTQFFEPADGVPNQRFANSVAMADTKTFICGSPTDPSITFNSGAVYSFTLP
jgi:FG-GAP repeat protein